MKWEELNKEQAEKGRRGDIGRYRICRYDRVFFR